MTAVISHTTIDATDAYAQSLFWAKVLGYAQDPDDPNEPGHEECWIQRPDAGHPLLFLEVPEGKAAKNRLHLDLRPNAGTRDDELARLLGLGAVEVADLRLENGRGWVVLADPEGNEFCVFAPAPGA